MPMNLLEFEFKKAAQYIKGEGTDRILNPGFIAYRQFPTNCEMG